MILKRSAAFTALMLAAACASAPVPDLSAAPEIPIPGAAPRCAAAPGLLQPGAARDAAFTALDPAGRAALLQTLPDCLENPDPALRDAYAFELLSLILRGEAQSADTLRSLKADLLARLASADEDAAGFRGPFAALALAEVARTDRIAPWMSEAERSALIEAAHAYLASLTDYRGYSDTEGWRHGVAHTADLLMQLSLNRQLTKPQAEAILAAIALKVATPDHAYIFGESERFAAPVMYLAQRELFTGEEWTEWFTGLWPADDPLRAAAYSSEAALARLHNLRAFSEAVYVSAVASHEDTYTPVSEAAFALLNQLP